MSIGKRSRREIRRDVQWSGFIGNRQLNVYPDWKEIRESLMVRNGKHVMYLTSSREAKLIVEKRKDASGFSAKVNKKLFVIDEETKHTKTRKLSRHKHQIELLLQMEGDAATRH